MNAFTHTHTITGSIFHILFQHNSPEAKTVPQLNLGSSSYSALVQFSAFSFTFLPPTITKSKVVVVISPYTIAA